MKKATFITLFVATNLLFIFVQIHKYSQVVKQSYRKQKNEKQRNELLQKKETLTTQFYELKSRQNVKTFAERELEMRPIAMNQIKKIEAR